VCVCKRQRSRGGGEAGGKRGWGAAKKGLTHTTHVHTHTLSLTHLTHTLTRVPESLTHTSHAHTHLPHASLGYYKTAGNMSHITYINESCYIYA